MSDCKCGRPTRDSAYTCDPCLDGLGEALSNLTWLNEELETTISKQRGLPTEGSAAGAEKSLPFNLAAAQVRDDLRNTLVGWVRICAEEGVRSSDPRDELPEDTLPEIARWLLWRVDGLAFHEAGYEACDEIAFAVRQAIKAIDRPAERQYVGPCACGRDLYRKPGAKMVRCRFCDAEYEAEVLTSELRARTIGMLVTAREGATLLSRLNLSTGQGTIDKWHERKRILERGHDEKGRRLYLFDELLTLAAQSAPRDSGVAS
jgi:hypothetical protein